VRRSALAGVALAAVVAAPGPAAAAPNQTAALARQLDGDAPLASRADIPQLEQLIALARRTGLPGANQTAFLVSAGATALVGFDPLSSAGWFYGGFDGDGAILASYGAIDGKAARAAAARGGKGAAVFWRSRLVIPVDDAGRADSSLRRFARLPGMASTGSAGAVGRLLGTGNGGAAARALRANGVVAVGKLPVVETLIFLRRKGAVAIVDLLTPFGGVPVRWDRDRARLQRLVGRAPTGLAVTGGAAATLRKPGLTLWADATAAYDAAGLLELDLDLRLRRAGAGGLPGLTNRPKVCASFRDVVTAGPFEDVAFRAAVGTPVRRTTWHASLRAGLTWGLRGPFKLANHFLVADDRLLDPGRMQGTIPLAGAIYLKSLEPIRTLPRPKVYQLERPELRYTLAGCGVRAVPTTALFGWPQLLAMFLDQVAGIHPQAAALVRGTRNSGFAFRQLALHRSGLRGFVEGSFDPAVVPYLDRYLDALFGARRAANEPHQRPHTTWGAGPIRPYRWTRGGVAVVGAAFDPKMVGWRMSRPKPPARSVKKLLAEIYLEPAPAVKQLLPEAPWLKPLVALAGQLGQISLHTRFDQGTLESFALTDIR
jgi:hypothetical protein